MNKQFEECKSPYSPTALVQREYLQALHERIEKLEAENQKFREALAYYSDSLPDDNILYRIKRKNKKELESAGDETNEFIYISGKRARAVLQKLEGGK